MTNKVLGGGSLDGSLGLNPDFSTLTIPLGRVVQSVDNEGYIQYWIIEETLKAGGNTLANGLYANKTTLREVGGSLTASDISVDEGGSVQDFVTEEKNKVALYASGGRNAIHYNNATSIYLNSSHMVMSGFRFRGQYTEGLARAYPTPNYKNVVSLVSDLGAESTPSTNNWYAIFAVANDGDNECSFKLIPFIHLGSPITSGRFRTVVGGDNSYSPSDTSDLKPYDWDVGVDLVNCLIITEDGKYSGRVSRIIGGGTTAGSNSITIENHGNITKGDWVLPSPKGYEFFRYCGSFYRDSAEVRNRADDGYYVGQRGAVLTQVSDLYGSGVVDSVEINPLGNISPLAVGIRFVSTSIFSTASTGSYNESYQTDSGLHTVDQATDYKLSTGTQVISNRYEVPFGIYPAYFMTNTGGVSAQRSGGKHLPWGYYE